MRRLVIVHSGSAFLLFRWPGGDLLVSNREADLPEILQNSVDCGQQRNSEYLVLAAPTAPSSLGSMVMAPPPLGSRNIYSILYTGAVSLRSRWEEIDIGRSAGKNHAIEDYLMFPIEFLTVSCRVFLAPAPIQKRGRAAE